MASKRRKKRKPVLTIFLLLAALFVAAIFLFDRYADLISDDPDLIALRAERTWRRAYAKAGLRIDGTPKLEKFNERLAGLGVKLGAPIFMRVFKKEFELEIWMQKGGRFHHFATYPICMFSGRLGPKLKQGDRQAPEGIYTVAANQLNPNSRWHRSFNLGYPNLFDREHKRTGDFLMVHGGCSSVGCYAMTNDVIDEIWKIVTHSLKKQQRFQVQIFPFRMTNEALNKRIDNKWLPFWQQLKIGHDMFEQSKIPPRVTICNMKYGFAEGKHGSDGSRKIVSSCDGVKVFAAQSSPQLN